LFLFEDLKMILLVVLYMMHHAATADTTETAVASTNPTPVVAETTETVAIVLPEGWKFASNTQ
jgi:hypothetical protein